MSDELLRCPACDEVLDGAGGEESVTVDADTVRAGVDCPCCGTRLILTPESAAPDAPGVNLSVECARRPSEVRGKYAPGDRDDDAPPLTAQLREGRERELRNDEYQRDS